MAQKGVVFVCTACSGKITMYLHYFMNYLSNLTKTGIYPPIFKDGELVHAIDSAHLALEGFNPCLDLTVIVSNTLNIMLLLRSVSS